MAGGRITAPGATTMTMKPSSLAAVGLGVFLVLGFWGIYLALNYVVGLFAIGVPGS